jgi:hypothetical protein
MSAELLSAASALVELLVGFEPSLYTGSDCATVAEVLARTEKACAAGRARAAARAATCGEHKARGFTEPADWMAAASGTTIGGARAELEACKATGRLPATTAALARGEVSLAEAAEIARAAHDLPGSEDMLLDLAKRTGLGALREEARRIVLRASSPDDLHKRQCEARHFRHWTDPLGMVRFSGALIPELGVGIMNRIEAEAARLRRAARSAARDAEHPTAAHPAAEPFEAYAADALVSLLAGEGSAGRGKAEVVYVADIRAVMRGHAHPGEPCHIVGGGPVSVRSVDQAALDAFIKVALHDGTKVVSIAHYGRHLPAKLRSALQLGRPPDFEGVRCSVLGCERRYNVEWDHVDPVANGGMTSYDNLQPRCNVHHWEKTERDRQAGLLNRERAPS